VQSKVKVVDCKKSTKRRLISANLRHRAATGEPRWRGCERDQPCGATNLAKTSRVGSCSALGLVDALSRLFEGGQVTKGKGAAPNRGSFVRNLAIRLSRRPSDLSVCMSVVRFPICSAYVCADDIISDGWLKRRYENKSTFNYPKA